MLYNMFTLQANQIKLLKENIISTIEDEHDDLNEKLDNIEQMIDKKINDCNKKIKDIYSLQNKVNEVNKMNNQSIINQFHQIDEPIEVEDNDEGKNQIFNSVENSQNNSKKNNCFVKISNSKIQDKDMFYMSPIDNKRTGEFSNTSSKLHKAISNSSSVSDTSSKVSKSTKTSKSSKSSKSDKYKKVVQSKRKDTGDSTVLELSGDFIKTTCINNNSPMANSAFKILNETSNIMKNSSYSKLSGLGSNSDSDSESQSNKNNSNKSNEQDYFLDHNDIIEFIKNNKKSKKTDKSESGSESESESESDNRSDTNSNSSSSSGSNSETSNDEISIGNVGLGADIFNMIINNKKQKIVEIE